MVDSEDCRGLIADGGFIPSKFQEKPRKAKRVMVPFLYRAGVILLPEWDVEGTAG